MVSTQVRFTVSVLALFVAVALSYAGGWSVITVKDLPDHVVMGKALTLTFTVRQHGNNLVGGLKPSIRATTSGGLETTAKATPTATEGEYTAKLVFSRTGDWTIRIDGGFNPEDQTRQYNSLTLAPIRVVDSKGPLPELVTESMRGEQLFAAKGCVGCHNGARDLTGKRFSPEYLAKFLANPAPWKAEMPNLGLKDEEIGALVAYINR